MKIVFAILISVLVFRCWCQENGVQPFSLEEAVRYALDNNARAVNAKIDQEIARSKIWEATAHGLPQVSSDLSYSYMLTIPEVIKQFSDLGPQPVKEEDLRWGLTYDLKVSQLLFSGSYLVGLQTARIYRALSDLTVVKTEKEIKETVTTTYLMALIARENSFVLDSTFSTTKKIYYEISELYAAGFMDATDADQMKLTVNTVENSLKAIGSQLEVALNLLKFQMGIGVEKQIELSDRLDELISKINLESYLTLTFSPTDYIDFQLLEKQETLARMNLKYQRSLMLPGVAAFYTHQENFNDKAFTFTPPDLLGLGVSIPIFSSGLGRAKIKQAGLELEKLRNTKNQVREGLTAEFLETKSTYINALNQYVSQTESVRLARRINQKNFVKYRQGLASSMDLAQASNQYFQELSSYYRTVFEILNAKNRLDTYSSIK